ncbi:MAG: glycosyltransferase family 2 protein [Armatimonadetes bacterium]|nr:glycosyltransferase family 2 protein [Armatimonadota bacterium]
MPKISIVYPMYNEEDNIHRAVAMAQRELGLAADGDYEIVIVNDASTDRTGEIAQQLAACDPRVKVVHHPINRKLGGSIRTGLANSTGDIIIYMDADIPCDLAHVHEALPKFEQADVVVGYRTNRHEGVLRWMYTRTYNFLVRILLKVSVRDVNCPFKLFKRQVIKAMELHSEGSFIDAEMLAEARRLGFAIEQIPVEFIPRQAGESTLARPSVIVNIIREFFQYLVRRKDISKETER